MASDARMASNATMAKVNAGMARQGGNLRSYGFLVPSQPNRPLSPQCVAMHSTMLARPNSDMPDNV